jgi:Flp pilus assembly protein TadB
MAPVKRAERFGVLAAQVWRRLSSGHIIGIVVGVVCALVAGICACLFKRAHARRQQRELAKQLPSLEMQAAPWQPHAPGSPPQVGP